MVYCIRKKWICLFACFCIGCLLLLGYWQKQLASPVFSPCRCPDQIIIIDAGHGGEDGGAISLSGQSESVINLSISHRLDAVLHFYGVNTLMTRTEEISLHDAGANSIHEKKVSDIRNRVSMIEAVENASLISIHQNSFPVSKYWGMQVFYTDEEVSMPLAQAIQDNVRLFLDSTNQRKPMKIPKTVYLMNHVSCPAVLVECGFLSNPKEDQLLQQDSYQTKIAITVAAACLQESIT